MTPEKLRTWWSHRQGLDGSLRGHSPAEVLEKTGWARSVGGAAPYLTLFARCRCSRAAVDESLAKAEIHELPSARRCTYVLPACDFALGLKAGQSLGEDPEMKLARKLGVTDAEVDKLCDCVVAALEKSTLEPDALREATAGAIRNLGEEGKKKGLTSTLPLALGRLQATGEIRRIPVNGRLDQQRYRYAVWRPNPLASFRLSAEETFVELARRYFRWIGPARIAEFQWFSGLGAKAARAAVEPLGLVDAGGGKGFEGLLMLPEDREEFERFKVPSGSRYVLVSSLDGIGQLRRDLKSLLAEEDLQNPLILKDRNPLADFPNHAILDRGRVVGLWDFDTGSGTIAWTGFTARSKALLDAVAAAERYVRDELGDARAFSLDSPKSRSPRIQALRNSAAAG
jgi:hypothetical protein